MVFENPGLWSNKSDLTHLQLGREIIVNDCMWTHLIYLQLDWCITDLVLPDQLQTFIGNDIQGSLTLSEMLTKLILTGMLPRLVGLERHRNLAVLRAKFLHVPNTVELPPNLVELQIASCNRDHLPRNIHILGLIDSPLCFSEAIEELHLDVTPAQDLLKLPPKLRVLTLPYFDDLSKEQLSKCGNLTKVVMNNYVRDGSKSLEMIDSCLPNLTDLSFRSNRASESMACLKFDNLRRLKISCKHMNEEETLDFGHLVNVSFLEFHCSCSRRPCTIELPRFLRGLRLTNDFGGNANSDFAIKLPVSVKVLHVHAYAQAFSIAISREHLAKLDIFGDRGQGEHNGRIVTTWGQFVLEQ